MPPPIRFRRCPRCARWVATNVRTCCEEVADTEPASEHIDDETVDECNASPDTSKKPWHHRLLWVQLAGILGPLSLFLTYNAVGFAAFASMGSIGPVTVVLWVVAGGVVLLGMGVCAAGVVLAFRAVTDMGGVPLDPEGRESAKFWGAMAGLALLVYWTGIGVWVYSWF